MLKTLSTCKTRSSHWEGHCLGPWVSTFCPEVQLNTASTVGAMSSFLCCLSKGFGCTLCQEQGQTCVTSCVAYRNKLHFGTNWLSGGCAYPPGC